MIHEFFTNKWILGAVSFIILFAGVCYLWYQHQLAPYVKQAADTAEFVHQWEINQKTQQKTSAAEIASPQAPAEHITHTAEKPITDTPQDNETTNRETHTDNSVTPKNIRMSTNGFGTVPEIPEGAPFAAFDETMSAQQELLYRVLVKLWNDGDRDIGGGFYDAAQGKVYPYYPNVIYVLYESELNERTSEYETVIAQAGSSYDNFDAVQAVARGDVPSGYTLIDMKDAGINPYEYLDLP